jgi:dipeptidyl aminopeptidase/acylaminoacyl peptidase
VKALTDRQGPDNNPVVSPDGSKIAYLGFDDRYQGYQVTKLYVMNADGSNARLISGDLDRDVNSIYWGADNQTIYFKYDDQGDTRLAKMDLSGKKTDLTNHLGGLSLGRPYGGSSFSANPDGKYAFTYGTWESPADLAVGQNGSRKRLTELNADLFSAKKIGEVEEIWYESSHDGRKIQGWICKPPNFDANKKYPLLLEIHGGPFSNYGNRFSAEVQMYAAAGYVVLYTNPRGSTSYGEEFGNLIHHNYPGEDYDDLISGVDAVIEKGYIDEDQLYVTGGSGGGVLTAWIVGNTDRFRAAVVAKPVINWYSFVLYADNPGYFYKYWFPGKPWDHLEHYMKRSPISLAKNVTTPTMLVMLGPPSSGRCWMLIAACSRMMLDVCIFSNKKQVTIHFEQKKTSASSRRRREKHHSIGPTKEGLASHWCAAWMSSAVVMVLCTKRERWAGFMCCRA